MHSTKTIPATKMLDVEMGTYQYLPKDQIPPDLKGFTTENVCECVCGFVSSSKGMAFFHFFRTDDPIHLAEKIQRDFGDDSDIKITLIGGNPGNLFLPWAGDKRELTVTTYDENGNSSNLGPDEAVKYIQREVILYERKDFTKLQIYTAEEQQQLKDAVTASILETHPNNLITYDFQALNKSINQMNSQLIGMDNDWRMKMYSVKDLIAYQNLARVLEALTTKTELFDANNIKHYNCHLASNVFAYFTGECGANHPDMNVFNIISKSATHEKLREATEYGIGEFDPATILSGNAIKVAETFEIDEAEVEAETFEIDEEELMRFLKGEPDELTAEDEAELMSFLRGEPDGAAVSSQDKDKESAQEPLLRSSFEKILNDLIVNQLERIEKLLNANPELRDQLSELKIQLENIQDKISETSSTSEGQEQIQGLKKEDAEILMEKLKSMKDQIELHESTQSAKMQKQAQTDELNISLKH